METSKLGFELRTGEVNRLQPLLYRIFVIESDADNPRCIYVGQSKNGAARPFNRYDSNVRRMQDGLGPLNGKAFREIHYHLLEAYEAGHRIIIELVRNVDTTVEAILTAESALQRAHGLMIDEFKQVET